MVDANEIDRAPRGCSPQFADGIAGLPAVILRFSDGSYMDDMNARSTRQRATERDVLSMRFLALIVSFFAVACSASTETSDAGDAPADVVYACPSSDAGGDCKGPDGGFLCTDPNKPFCVAGQCSFSYGYCASTPTNLQPCVAGEATCPNGVCAIGTPCTMKEGFKGTCQCSGP